MSLSASVWFTSIAAVSFSAALAVLDELITGASLASVTDIVIVWVSANVPVPSSVAVTFIT